MSRRPLARVGEYGFELAVSSGYDASAGGQNGAVESAEIVVRKPDGTEAAKPAATVNAAGGEFFWTVTPGFLDQTGEYQVILQLTFAEAFLVSDVETFQVGARFSA